MASCTGRRPPEDVAVNLTLDRQVTAARLPTKAQTQGGPPAAGLPATRNGVGGDSAANSRPSAFVSGAPPQGHHGHDNRHLCRLILSLTCPQAGGHTAAPTRFHGDGPLGNGLLAQGRPPNVTGMGVNRTPDDCEGSEAPGGACQSLAAGFLHFF